MHQGSLGLFEDGELNLKTEPTGAASVFCEIPLFENLYAAAILISESAKLLTLNSAAQLLVGQSANDLSGRHIFELVRFESRSSPRFIESPICIIQAGRLYTPSEDMVMIWEGQQRFSVTDCFFLETQTQIDHSDYQNTDRKSLLHGSIVITFR